MAKRFCFRQVGTHVTYTRGPEYQVLERDIEVPAGKQHTESFRMERWINLAAAGWYSGDHHVHAAGCAPLSSPTQGVTPADMMRHNSRRGSQRRMRTHLGTVLVSPKGEF